MICTAGTNTATQSDTFFLIDTSEGDVVLELYDATASALQNKPMRIDWWPVGSAARTVDVRTTGGQLINGRSHVELAAGVFSFALAAYHPAGHDGAYTLKACGLSDEDQAKVDEL